MATIKVRREHRLGTEKACATVEHLARRLKQELGADYRWEGSTLKFSRSGATGHIDVTDTSVEVEVRLGMLLGPLKNSIQKTIEEEIDGHLST